MPKTKSSPPPRPAGPTMVLTRIFDAPRSLVFAAWTQPEHLKHWSAPRGFTITRSEGELRPGGAWRSSMRGPDGVDLPLSGKYEEIVQDELLVFTHSWEDDEGRREHETIVTVRFKDFAGKTKLTLEQGPFESEQSRDGHEGGWSECLDRLGELLDAAKVTRVKAGRLRATKKKLAASPSRQKRK